MCIRDRSKAVLTQENGITQISNDWLQVGIDGDGELVSVFDKTTGRQILKDGRKGNRLKLQEDIPVEWGSAWEVTTKREDKAPFPFTGTSQCIKEHNDLYTVLSAVSYTHLDVYKRQNIQLESTTSSLYLLSPGNTP